MMLDYLLGRLQHIVPQHGLSRIVYHATRCRLPWLKNFIIGRFVRYFDVDMSQARQADGYAYPHFNAFFTRELRPGSRPVSDSGVCCPVDGFVSRTGDIEAGKIVQAKGKDYSLSQLLAGDEEMIGCFTGGSFATLYLSPRNYHRIHMPLDGVLRRMMYVPGRLFSVNPRTLAAVSGVFARNERLICLFETEAGPMAMILVGAIFVGNMEMVWHGEVDASGRSITQWSYRQGRLCLARGEEAGRFNMGSTVILLFGPDRVRWNASLVPDTPLLFGQSIAEIAG